MVANGEHDMRNDSNGGAPALPEPAFVSIKAAAEYSSESEWVIKQELRFGNLTAKKSGRRTLVDFQSVKRRAASLPDAKFAPPRRRKVA
jgi:hypothetical protein